ncbi:MAG: hypothetical protein Q7S40_06920 [Opitutaceae bacterium]|nr:hypothetical protein [Opitutaceae bacterium]
MLQLQRWDRLSRNVGLLAAMNLPPDKSGPFKDLLVEREYAESDARDAADGAGIDPNSAEATEAAANAMSRVDERIRALLNDGEFARYSEAVGTSLARNSLAHTVIVGCFIDLGAPLTAAQETALAQAGYRAIQLQTQSAEPDPLTGLTPSQQIILDGTSQTLAAGQIEILRKFFLNDNQLGALLKAAQSSAGPR